MSSPWATSGTIARMWAARSSVEGRRVELEALGVHDPARRLEIGEQGSVGAISTAGAVAAGAAATALADPAADDAAFSARLCRVGTRSAAD